MTSILGLNSTQQKQQISAALDRTYLLIQAGIQVRQQKELDAVQARFSGTTALTSLQQDINRLSEVKTAADDAVMALKSAADTSQGVLERLNEALAAARSGNAGAFDAAIGRLNISVGSRGAGLDDLVGNVAAGQTGTRTEFVDAGASQILVSLRSMGSRYALVEQGTGRRFEPDYINQTLSIGNQRVPFANLTLTSRTDDTLTFTDGTDSWTADFEGGGLPVGSAWTYGGLTGEGQTRAIEDITAAMKLARRTMDTLSNSSLQAEVGSTMLQGRLDAMGDEALRLNDAQFDEMAAAKAAINTRYEMALRGLAFSAQAQREVIGALVQPEQVTNKGIFGILSGS